MCDKREKTEQVSSDSSDGLCAKDRAHETAFVKWWSSFEKKNVTVFDETLARTAFIRGRKSI